MNVASDGRIYALVFVANFSFLVLKIIESNLIIGFIYHQSITKFLVNSLSLTLRPQMNKLLTRGEQLVVRQALADYHKER